MRQHNEYHIYLLITWMDAASRKKPRCLLPAFPLPRKCWANCVKHGAYLKKTTLEWIRGCQSENDRAGRDGNEGRAWQGEREQESTASPSSEVSHLSNAKQESVIIIPVHEKAVRISNKISAATAVLKPPGGSWFNWNSNLIIRKTHHHIMGL